MSRRNRFFNACKVDNYYIFQHSEYEWDDIVNAFIAGGLYADSCPEFPWIPLKDSTIGTLFDRSRYLVYRQGYDEYMVLDGMTLKNIYQEGSFTHAKLIEGPDLFSKD